MILVWMQVLIQALIVNSILRSRIACKFLLITSLFCADLFARFCVSFSGGITSYNHNVSYLVPLKKYDKYENYQAWMAAFAEYMKEFDKDWNEDLVANIDMIGIAEYIGSRGGTAMGLGIPGVGRVARNYDSCNRKVSSQLKVWRDKAEELFSKFGFEIRGDPVFECKDGRTIEMYPVIICHSSYTHGAYIITKRGEIRFDLTDDNVSSSANLMAAITDIARPSPTQVERFFRNVVEAEAMLAAKSSVKPSVTKKNGLTLGVSCSYNKSIFPKVSSKYGLYLGIEGFTEINPNEAKASGYSVKEKSFGIRPFVGLVSKDKWALYGVFGVKCAKRKIKSNEININKGKMAYEIGVGSDYILSDRFSISAKFIKTLKTTVRVQNSRLSSTSTKFLLSLNYHIG